MKYMGRNGYGCSRLSTDRGGVVLNISSVQGLMAWPAMPTYSAAKAAMITYTRSALRCIKWHWIRICQKFASQRSKMSNGRFELQSW